MKNDVISQFTIIRPSRVSTPFFKFLFKLVLTRYRYDSCPSARVAVGVPRLRARWGGTRLRLRIYVATRRGQKSTVSFVMYAGLKYQFVLRSDVLVIIWWSLMGDVMSYSNRFYKSRLQYRYLKTVWVLTTKFVSQRAEKQGPKPASENSALTHEKQNQMMKARSNQRKHSSWPRFLHAPRKDEKGRPWKGASSHQLYLYRPSHLVPKDFLFRVVLPYHAYAKV